MSIKTIKEVQNTEVITPELTEESVTEVVKSKNVIGRTFDKIKVGGAKHKKIIITTVAAFAVGAGVGILGLDYGKRNGLQKEGQGYIEGEFTEVEPDSTELETSEELDTNLESEEV